MRSAWCAGILALLTASPALAQQEAATQPASPETKLIIEINAGAGYSFADGAALPTFDETSVNSSYTFGVQRWDWTLSFAYLEGKNDQEGNQVALSYEKKKDCPLLPSDTLGCSLGIQVRDMEAQSTVKYSAGVRGPLLFSHPNIRPAWTLSGAALTGDRTETTLTAGIELPFTFDPRGTATDPNGDPRWTVTGTAALMHGFEADTTLPTWGIRVAYNFTRDASFSVGYESKAVLDPIEDDLDVDRAATARLKIKF